MSEELEISEGTARRIAEHSIEISKTAISFMMQQHADSFKWITASLLTINSGGAFAILSSDKIDIFTKKISGSLFSIGILLAMLVAVVAQRLTARALPILNRQVGFWLAVLEDGQIPLNFNEIENQNSKDAVRFQWIVPLIGWISAACFVAGIISVGANLKPEKARDSVAGLQIQPNESQPVTRRQ